MFVKTGAVAVEKRGVDEERVDEERERERRKKEEGNNSSKRTHQS